MCIYDYKAKYQNRLQALYFFLGTVDPESNDMKYPVLLMESVQKMAQDFQSLLTDKDKKKLAGFMRKLGFDDVAASFYDLPAEESGKKVHITMEPVGFPALASWAMNTFMQSYCG